MKILHLTTHLNHGGITRYILSLGSALRERGHQIFVASSGGEMEAEFREKGFAVRNFNLKTKSELSPKIYGTLSPLIRWTRDEGIDLVHAHNRVSQVTAFWTGQLGSAPFVTTCHGFYPRRLGRRILPAWGRRVVAISAAVGEHLKEVHRVPERKIRVIYNGIDIEGLRRRVSAHNGEEVRRGYGIPEKVPVIGVISRLIVEKGHEYLIRALKSLESDLPEAALLIVGDGRERRTLEGLAGELGLTHRVHFTGNVQDISKPLAALDLFVLPAVWREGFGLSIAEAMASRMPVVITNTCALAALIQDGVNGRVVKSQNAEELAHAIRSVLKDGSFRQRMGEAAGRTAEEHFSLSRMAGEFETLYEEALRG